MKSLRPSSLDTALETPYPSSASTVTRMSTTAGLSSITRILAVGTFITAVHRPGPTIALSLTESTRSSAPEPACASCDIFPRGLEDRIEAMTRDESGVSGARRLMGAEI
jgi:hypothetical protein